MKLSAMITVLVGMMSLPALARDNYNMYLGVSTPSHDTALGTLHSEGFGASLDYAKPKTGDGTTGLSAQYGASNWGAGLKVTDLDTAGDMTVMGGYNFGAVEVALDYNLKDDSSEDADWTLYGRYAFNDTMRLALAHADAGEGTNTVSFGWDYNDFTMDLGYAMPGQDGVDGMINLGLGYYAGAWTGGVLLMNASGANDVDMQPTVQVGYAMDKWHANLAYNTELESMALHATMNF